MICPRVRRSRHDPAYLSGRASCAWGSLEGGKLARPMRRIAAAGVVAVLATGLLTVLAGAPAFAAPVVYEAEQATIVNGGTVDSDHPGFTGTGFVNTTNAVGAGVEFTLTIGAAGTATLIFRYANGTTSDRTAGVAVNGTVQSTLAFPPTGSWDTWGTQTVTVSLIAGANVVRTIATTSTGLANMDSLTVEASTPYEAENATIIGGGTVDSNHPGFTGTGFVNTANAVGAGVEFTVASTLARAAKLVFRYANGTTSDRAATVAVNGLVQATLAFPPTGSWDTWSTQTVTVHLNAGSNAVRAAATTSDGLANLDSLTDERQQTGPLSDPVAEDPIASGLGLTLAQFAQFPQSFPVPTPTDSRLMRWARINFLGQIPGSNLLFTPDLNGKLYTVPPTGGTPSVYLDVSDTVGANFFSGKGMGSGFGFVAFHPDFATNGRFYTTHSEAFTALTSITPDWTQTNAVIHSVVTEWTATNPAAATFSGTRRTLMRIGFASYLHAIQQIDFNRTAAPGGPDYGLLYIAVGDGGIGYQTTVPQQRGVPHGKILRIDFNRTAAPGGPDYGLLYIAVGDGGIGYQTTVPQQRGVPHGKILRIDPRGTNSANGRYGIPSSNPFVGPTRTGSVGTPVGPTGCSSATSASTTSKASTTCGPGTTSAGASGKARSCSTGRRSATSTRFRPTTRRSATPTRSPPTTTTRPGSPAARTPVRRSSAASSTAATRFRPCGASTCSATWSTAGSSTPTRRT